MEDTSSDIFGWEVGEDKSRNSSGGAACELPLVIDIQTSIQKAFKEVRGARGKGLEGRIGSQLR